jgi:hypothetical protein
VKRAQSKRLPILILLLIGIFLADCNPQQDSTPSSNSSDAAGFAPVERQMENLNLLQILTESITPISNPNRISPENVADLTFLSRFGEPGQSAIWSPDNRIFVIGSSDEISLYDVRSFVLINSLKIENLWAEQAIPSGLYINSGSITFSPNGRILAFSANQNANDIVLMDASTLEILEVISLDIENLSNFMFSADGSKLLGTTSGYAQNSSMAWNLFTYDISSAQITFLLDDAVESEFLTLSPDGTSYITKESNSSIALWNTETGTKMNTFKGPAQISTVLFANNQTIAIGYQNNTIILWDESGSQTTKLNAEILWPYLNSISMNENGDLVAVADSEGMIDLFNAHSGELIKSMDTEYSQPHLSFNPEGSILSADTNLNGVAFWTTNQEIMVNVSANHHPDQEIKENFASLPSGGYILYSDGQGMKVISEDGKYRQVISSTLQGIPISADGRILSTLSDSNSNDHSGYINLLTGENKQMEQLGAISPDLKWIAEADYCDAQINQLGLEVISIKANTTFCTYIDKLKWLESNQTAELISRVRWSPDASQLAYMKVSIAKPEFANQDWSTLASSGLYIVDASCFQDPRTCNQKTSFSVFAPQKAKSNSTSELYLNWSPDGTVVVLNSGQLFIVSDLKTKYAWKLEKIPSPLKDSYQYFGISPDNEWIAYSGDSTNILLQPIYDGEPIEIAHDMENVQVLGWIMAPLLETEAAFRVLPGGDHVRIRRTANFNSIQTGTLYDGNTFTVLDGPVQEDGYTWWYIHSDVDGVEGWVTEFYGRYEN